MELNEALDHLLIPGIKKTVTKHDDSVVELAEDDPQAAYKQVCITGIPSGSVLLRMEAKRQEPRTKRLYESKTGLWKQCDYAIVIPKKQRAVFIELKSYNYKESEVAQQLMSSYCLFCYISHALNTVCENLDIGCGVQCNFAMIYAQNVPVSRPDVDEIYTGRNFRNFKRIAYTESIPLGLFID